VSLQFTSHGSQRVCGNYGVGRPKRSEEH
jgi:hypothetical protein